jgi:hypothetical protein
MSIANVTDASATLHKILVQKEVSRPVMSQFVKSSCVFRRIFLPREGTVEIPVFFAGSAQAHEYKPNIFNQLALAEREGFEPF